MLEIQNTLVSLDVVEKYFCCDLEACHGQCCLDGDAGAPLEEGEADEIRRILPEIFDELLPGAQREILENSVSYIDEDGDEVTSLVEGTNCVFATLDEKGQWLCAIEKAYREGRIDYYKPISCHLYPVRLAKYPSFTAVNFHKWKICKAAEILGRKENLRLYRFLEGPLTRKFGADWYAELKETADEYLRQNPSK